MASNGRIPLSQLRRVKHVTGGNHYLRADASLALDRLALIAKSQGHGAYVTDSYRDYATQVRLRADWCARGSCNYAATPGTSNHGWGLAVDAADSRVDGLARWMHANEKTANTHGWHWPHWARPPGVVERWHWEYSPELDRHRNQHPQVQQGGGADVIHEGDKGAAVEALQMACNDYRHYGNLDREREGNPQFEVKALRLDGAAGPLTFGVARALLRDLSIKVGKDDGIPDACVAILSRHATRAQQRLHSFKPHGDEN